MYFNLTPDDKESLYKLQRVDEEGNIFLLCGPIDCSRCPISNIIMKYHKTILKPNQKAKETSCATIYRLMMEQIKLENKLKEVIKDGTKHL